MRSGTRWLGFGLLGLIGLAVIARGAFFLAYVYFQGRTPFEAFHLESKMVWMAWRAAEGLSMYPAWSDLPNYEPNFFGPLYFLLVGWIGRAMGADLEGMTLIGRGVTVAAGLAAAGLVAWGAGKRYGKVAGVVAGISTLGPAPMSGFGVMARPDLMADTLGFAGFLAATSGPGKRGSLVLGGLLLAASGLTKQTCALYLVAAVVGLFVTGRRRAAVGLGAGVGLGVAAVLGLGVLFWEPRLLVDLLGEAATPTSFPDWRKNLWRLWMLGTEMVALWGVGLLLWIGKEERDYALVALNVVIVGGAVATSTKLGADLNYFLGPRLVASMALGAVWHAASRVFGGEEGGEGRWAGARKAVWLGGLGALLYAQVWGLIHMGVQEEVYRGVQRELSAPAGRAMLREYRSLCAMVADPGTPVLTDDGGLALQQRERAPFVDPWLFRMRVVTGRMRAEAMEAEIERGAYRYIITRHDLMAPTYETYDFGLPPVMAQIARRRYRLAGATAGRYVYEPIEGAR